MKNYRANPKKVSDIGNANKWQKTSYLVTPKGDLQRYNPKNGEVKVISTSMPSDPQNSKRVNKFSPLMFTKSIELGNYNTKLFLLLLYIQEFTPQK